MKFNDHFSGPRRAVDPEYVSVCQNNHCLTYGALVQLDSN